MSEQQPSTNADAIADAKISPGDDYEEIREQVRTVVPFTATNRNSN